MLSVISSHLSQLQVPRSQLQVITIGTRIACVTYKATPPSVWSSLHPCIPAPRPPQQSAHTTAPMQRPRRATVRSHMQCDLHLYNLYPRIHVSAPIGSVCLAASRAQKSVARVVAQRLRDPGCHPPQALAAQSLVSGLTPAYSAYSPHFLRRFLPRFGKGVTGIGLGDLIVSLSPRSVSFVTRSSGVSGVLAKEVCQGSRRELEKRRSPSCDRRIVPFRLLHRLRHFQVASSSRSAHGSGALGDYQLRLLYSAPSPHLSSAPSGCLHLLANKTHCTFRPQPAAPARRSCAGTRPPPSTH